MSIFQYLPYALRAVQHESEIKDLAVRLWALEPAVKEAAALVARGKALVEEIAPGLLPQENYDVKWIQSSLNAVSGENLTVDGDYGAATHEAVKRFQTTHGLVCDGWVGLRTMSALFTLSNQEKKS